MKKLLTILSSFAVTATGVSTVVACGDKEGTKKDISGLGDAISVTSEGNLAKFRAGLIAEIVKSDDFKEFSDTDLDIIKKEDDKDLGDSDLTANNTALKIKITAKGDKFTGTKTITVNFTVSTTPPVGKKNLTTLTDPTIESAATVVEFKKALIAAIKLQSGFNTLDGSKLEIKKDNSGNPGDALKDTADDTYITGAKITVHLSLKADYTDFEGTKKLSVTWSLPKKPNLNKLTDPTIESAATVVEFKKALIAAIKLQSGFNTLDGSKLEIKKDNSGNPGDALKDTADDTYITGAKITVHLSLKAGYTDFEGTKKLSVTWSLPKKPNLNKLTDPTIQSAATVVEFKKALITAIKLQDGFNTLDEKQLEIKKDASGSAGADLTDGTDDSYITGAKITVHLSLKAGYTNFEGTKKLTVNWTVKS